MDTRSSKLDEQTSAVPFQNRTSSFKHLVSIIWSLIDDDLRITMSAQMFTVPIIMFQFHRISLVSPLTNILIGWLMAPITVIGFAVVVGGLLWMPLGLAAAWVAWVPLQYILIVIDLTAKIPFASLSW